MSEVTLRELIEAEIRRIEAQIGSLVTSVDKSEDLLNRRLEGMNEFRDALKDQSSQMATREQLRMMAERLEDRNGQLNALLRQIENQLDTRLRQLENQRYFVIGIATAIALLISLAGMAIQLI